MNDPKGKIEEIRNSPLNMNGTEQHITSLYYPQSNGLSKRQGLRSKGSWWKRLRLTIHCLRNFICEFRIFPSTSNLNWSVLKKRAMVNLYQKNTWWCSFKCYLLIISALKHWWKQSSCTRRKTAWLLSTW